MILLDTHTAIWAVTDSKRLGARARRLIVGTPSIFVSSLTHAEIAIKRAKGRLRVTGDFAHQLAGEGLVELPFSNRHAEGVEDLVGRIEGDPFDWMLLAQAQVDGLTLVTADRKLLDFEGTFDATT